MTSDPTPTLDYANRKSTLADWHRAILIPFGWLAIIVGAIQVGAVIHEMTRVSFPVFGWKAGSRFWAIANLLTKYNYGSLAFACSAMIGGVALVTHAWIRRWVVCVHAAVHLCLGVMVIGAALVMVLEFGKVWMDHSDGSSVSSGLYSFVPAQLVVEWIVAGIPLALLWIVRRAAR